VYSVGWLTYSGKIAAKPISRYELTVAHCLHFLDNTGLPKPSTISGDLGKLERVCRLSLTL
jgi:hypothetical protein